LVVLKYVNLAYTFFTSRRLRNLTHVYLQLPFCVERSPFQFMCLQLQSKQTLRPMKTSILVGYSITLLAIWCITNLLCHDWEDGQSWFDFLK